MNTRAFRPPPFFLCLLLSRRATCCCKQTRQKTQNTLHSPISCILNTGIQTKYWWSRFLFFPCVPPSFLVLLPSRRAMRCCKQIQTNAKLPRKRWSSLSSLRISPLLLTRNRLSFHVCSPCLFRHKIGDIHTHKQEHTHTHTHTHIHSQTHR